MGAPSPLKHSPDCGVNSTGECDCGVYEASAWAAAAKETERLQRELDISNADHIALWLESNTIPDEPMSQCISWLACRIVEAYEAATAELYEAAKKHLEWIDKEKAGPDYGGMSRDAHPDGERIWRRWWDEQLHLCADTERLCRAALAKARGESLLVEQGDAK